MKHTLRIKWLAVGLAALSFARSAYAVTNDPFVAHKATLERAIGLINTGKMVRVSPLLSEASRMIEAMEKSGDRSLLPYLAEKSLNTANPETVRECSAAAYVKIANVDESVVLMRKLNEDPSAQGAGRYLLNKAFLEKVKSEESTLAPKIRDAISSFLLEIVQNAKTPGDARNADQFLLDRIPEYANSRQRATLTRYANTGNEYTRNTFNPIKAHFDKIPPSKRTDLRKRFPNLPPLPEDKNAWTPLKVALAIGAALAAFIAVCVVILIRANRRGKSE